MKSTKKSIDDVCDIDEDLVGDKYTNIGDKYITEAALDSVCRRIAEDVSGNDGVKAIGMMHDLLQKISSSVSSIERDGKKMFRLQELYFFFDNWRRAFETSNYEYLAQPRGMLREIVSVEEFICSSEYMNQGEYIRPAILSEMKRLFRSSLYKEAVLCLSGKTTVPLLDGTTPTIRELAESKKGESFWVYSHDGEKFIPALARLPHKTGKDILWRVDFTDGSHIDANSRHQFIDVEGNKITVSGLRSGDRLRSFYARKCHMGMRGKLYLREIYSQKGGRGKFVHRQVMEHTTGFSSRRGWLRHHKNFNGMDNRPDNLEWITKEKHEEMHHDLALQNIAVHNSKPAGVRRKVAQCNAKKSKRWEDPKQHLKASERMRIRNLSGLSVYASRRFWSSEEGAEERDRRSERCRGNAGRFVSNHVVKSIKCLGVCEDVYCLTVDSTGVFFVGTEGNTDFDLNCVLSSNTGAIGIGKNYMADLCVAYMIYRLSCFRSPQAEFGLAPGSSIVFIAQSATAKLAKKVVFGNLAEKIKESKYFKENFKPDSSINSELVFPNNITVLPVSGSDTAALGMNVFGGIIDEMNFMPKVKGSAFARLRGEEEYDKAQALYRSIIRRMESRFMILGKLPGKLILVSSSNYPGDFTDSKVEEAKTDKSIFIMCMAQWEALPASRFCGDTFVVEIGDDKVKSRILKDGEVPEEGKKILNVPIEYKKDFEIGMDDALRDIAGIAVSHSAVFIPQRTLIGIAVKKHNEIVGATQLFTEDEVDLRNYDDSDLADLISAEYVDKYITNWKKNGFTRDPVFGAHIDSALSSDKVGISVGRIFGFDDELELKVYMPKQDQYSGVRGLRAPILFVDGVLRVMPPPGDEIDLEKVQGIVFQLLNAGVHIQYLSMDKFESAQMLGNIRRQRFVRTARVSVDRSLEPYMALKLAYREERIMQPEHKTLNSELANLIIDRKKRKVDHPAEGSKDIADSVCGLYTLLSKLKATYLSADAKLDMSKARRKEEPEEMEEEQEDPLEEVVGERVRRIRRMIGTDGKEAKMLSRDERMMKRGTRSQRSRSGIRCRIG